ncbi:hypothetical protein DE146DRAFT_780020 [Phaeosphaeria sp. MPI-PUGE-AT-0046c]|nr:hypothetical protein DE146DRAFT_780020 [Phaeosphaeria sp. MPI-PUGE-AT-0046c]
MSGSNDSSPANSTSASNPAPQSMPTNQNSKTMTMSSKYPSKFHSTTAVPSDPETARIVACLESGGIAADLAEERYRICRLNASLRRELEEAKRALCSPQLTDIDVARINNRIDDGASVKEVAEEAYRVCRINAHLRTANKEVQETLWEAKKKLAVKDDALSEMRAESPELRHLLQRAMSMMKEMVNIPADFRTAYSAIMLQDMHDWQPRLGTKKYYRTSAQKKGKGKAKEKKAKPEKTKNLRRMDHGKTYDLSKSIANQDQGVEGEVSKAKPEPAPSKKRKGTVLEASEPKRARVGSDLEEGEIEE